MNFCLLSNLIVIIPHLRTNTKKSGTFLIAFYFVMNDLGLVVSSLSLFNCSQTKFVAIILVLRYFYAFFHLTNFLSDAYDFTFCCPRALSFAARGHS